LSARVAGDPRIADEIQDLRRQLNWYYHRLDLEQMRPEGISPERVARLSELARSHEDELLHRLRELPASSDEGHSLTSAATITVSGVRAVIPANTVLVEYYQAGPDIIAAVLDRTTLKIVRLTTAQRVAESLRMLQFQFSRFRLSPARKANPQTRSAEPAERHLQALYQELVAPIRHLLTGSHLVLVPHGILHHIPLHALHDGREYLIDRFTISYAPSASVWAICQRRAAVSGEMSLILGVHGTNTPWIPDEVREVAAVLPNSRVFKGAEATYNVLRTFGPASRFIHIATHGVFRQDNPLFSMVKLGDSHLSHYDLYRLQLPAELVTVSGCATGMNVVTAGDETMGLARGLLYAGARTLLLTLWDVHDRSTAEFMRCFYQQLGAKGKSKSEALREAMLETRNRYPHPHDWAPFVLVGNAP
jgi:CHAT domain-containing protein